MKRVLITGATGFVGSAILVEYIKRHQSDHLLLLARPKDGQTALDRIKAQLALFALSNEEISCLTENNILEGSLSDNAWYQYPISQSIETIINCAALASFGSNPKIWQVNVDDTFHFAKNASTLPNLKRFIQVSTGMACGMQAKSPIREDYDVQDQAVHIIPYTRSKAHIEQRLRLELPKLPLVIVRPSIVVGHSKLGCTPSPSIFLVFNMVKLLGQFVADPNEHIDVIPVDWCAEAIVSLAEKSKLQWSKYHIASGTQSSCRFEDIYQAMNQASGTHAVYERTNYEHLYALRGSFKQLLGQDVNERIVLKAIKLYGEFSLLNYIFDNSRLISEGIPHSPRLLDYIDQCCHTTRKQTIAQQMTYDFK